LTIARDGLGLSEIYLGGRPDGWQDDFLKRADENPNRKGVELVAQAYDLKARPFADLVAAAGAGQVKALWAVGTEVPGEAEALAGLAGLAVVAQATNDGPLAQAAEVLLPASTHAESDGTFVNFEGRAQRFEMAYFPRGESRPHWALAAEIGRALGISLAVAGAREVFRALGPRLGDALGDFRWDGLASVGRRPGIIPLAAGTVDGRLAGYRERVPPETSEDQRRALQRTAHPEEGGRP
jgi:NADH-quinone oxidoreductase subunit G